MSVQVGIVGASGYAGIELVRMLSAHPEMELRVLAANSRAGEPLSSVFPNVVGGRVFDAVDTDVLGGLDLVFLATPHEASLSLAAPLLSAGAKVVDLSGAFRLDTAQFHTWYGDAHPSPDLTPAVYGLTEFNRAEIAGAQLVANPGCYVTTALLGLIPIAPLLLPGSVIVDGKSGTSGAGRRLRETLHHPHVSGSLSAYGAPTHRHTIEIERYLDGFGRASLPSLGALSFTPHLLPIARGLATTSYASLKDGVGQDDADRALQKAYADEAFVHVLNAGTFPSIKAVVGSNGCHISAIVDERTRRVVVTAVTDNLLKGAAGQALQNANLMCGLDETLAIPSFGIYP